MVLRHDCFTVESAIDEFWFSEHGALAEMCLGFLCFEKNLRVAYDYIVRYPLVTSFSLPEP